MIEVPKITKMDAFSLFQSKTSIFHDERASSMSFPCKKKGRRMLQLSPKFSTMVTNKKDDTATNTQTPKIRSVQHIQNSNFRFKSREKCSRGSERCEKDHTAINCKIETPRES
jgi:hypothetical protein